MKRKKQPGFFDIEERTAKLTEMGDPLVGLKVVARLGGSKGYASEAKPGPITMLHAAWFAAG